MNNTLASSIISLYFLLTPLTLYPQSTHWHIESEVEGVRVILRHDTLDITAPKGLSLWYDQPLQAPCTIDYHATVIMQGGPHDRLSDLNCFWMATHNDGSPLTGIPQRQGRFLESYRLKCYYLGYGGNYNTTTRFRRYNADSTAVTQPERRPKIIKEYTDSQHLLQPNHWYHIHIDVSREGRVRYFIDDELIVDFIDPQPLLMGWFAFRTTSSHTRLTNFTVSTTNPQP